jgi:uncharacterized protein (DUF849 family)
MTAEVASPADTARPTVICVAPNGARRTQADHPALPLGPDEMAATARSCADAGATVLHLHVRDEAHQHSLDVGRYREAMAAVRDATGERLLVQVTTEAVGRYRPQEQMDTLRHLQPACASVAVMELVPDAAAEAEAARFYAWAHDHGVGLQHIVYSAEQARRLIDLVERGVVCEARPNTLFVLGRYTAGQRSQPADLLPFLSVWPGDWPWSVCAFGPTEALCMAAAIALGGHVRVGFENNLQRPDGSPAQDNADLVANIAALATHAGRPPATVDQARQVYGASA